MTWGCLFLFYNAVFITSPGIVALPLVSEMLKRKHVLRRWRLERFDEFKVRITYQKALQAEVLGFTESASQKVESGMKGEPLAQEWEDIVNRVAKSVVGEKMIVCSKSSRWWDNED